MTFLRRDLVTSGRVPLVLARVYDSSSTGSIEFGPGWTLSVAETISIQDRIARLRSESGAVVEFAEAGASTFVLQQERPSDYSQLLRKSPDTIEARLRTGFAKEYRLISHLYRLTKVTDRNGNEVRITYTTKGVLSKVENEGHFIEFNRDQHGRIIHAQDDQGRQVHFLYNAKKELIEADDLGGQGWAYQYTEDGRLKSGSDPVGRLNFGVIYDQAHRVRRLQLPSGVIQYNYNPETRSTTVIDRKQLISRFFQNEEGITTRVVNALGEETTIGLDIDRNAISLARSGVVAQIMEYDQQHRLITRHSFTGSRPIDIRYSYDLSTGLLARIDSSDGGSQSFGYDVHGNLVRAALSDGLRKYSYSSTGDLTGFSQGSTDLAFTLSPDGLISSMRENKTAFTLFSYQAGGELSEVKFDDGQTARYAYQPSGLRARLTYQDKRRVEYTYDPVGNLLSTNIFDVNGKQVQGQKLTLNDSYQVTKRVLFDATQEAFEYDPNGNLVKHVKNGFVTEFEYDELNRLTAILTPTGERLTYSYGPGEHSVVEQYGHSNIPVADLRDTGFTFAASTQVMATRPIPSLLGAVRFSENLGTFQLANANGTEIVTPETAIEQSLHKLNLTDGSSPLRRRQNAFNRPFNTIFMPAEYATINCCFSCSDGSQCRAGLAGGGDTTSCCPPCDPVPPSVPSPPPPPSISGPNAVWWFSGQSPSGYATSITLTSSGGAATAWQATAGANQVSLSSTSGSQITVTATGNPVSSSVGDVSITATANNQTSSPFSITTRRPFRLVAGTPVKICSTSFGYVMRLPYTIQDNLLADLPSSVPVNENFTTAFISDFPGTNWTTNPPNSVITDPASPATFSDTISPPALSNNPAPFPTPVCNGISLQVQHAGQELRIGSTQIGVGTRVQTDVLSKFTEHGLHDSIMTGSGVQP